MYDTRRTARLAIGIIATLTILVACARTAGPSASGDASDASTTERPVASIREFQTVPPSSESVIGEVPDEVLEPILTAAAEQTGVAAAEITVIQAEQVTWPDGSLGCPEPGQVYTQALVDGYQVVLDAGGEELDYRVGSGGSFRLCEGFPGAG